jgi:IstB-like ATP binding protein
VIDEVGYLPQDGSAADHLYNVISARHETRSTVITTNLSFKQWSTVFPGAACLVALVDRFTQHCEVLDIDADSYRQKKPPASAAAKGLASTLTPNSSEIDGSAPPATGATRASWCARRWSITTTSPGARRGSYCVLNHATKRARFADLNIVERTTQPDRRIAPSRVRLVPQFIGTRSLNSRPRSTQAWLRPIPG